jgi:hypothetical protein
MGRLGTGVWAAPDLLNGTDSMPFAAAGTPDFYAPSAALGTVVSPGAHPVWV